MSDETFDQNAWLAALDTTVRVLQRSNSPSADRSALCDHCLREYRCPSGSTAKTGFGIASGKNDPWRAGWLLLRAEHAFSRRAAIPRLKVTSLQARVVRGLEIDAPRPMLHMVLRVDLPEGPFLADVGFGNLAPTAPLRLSPLIEQQTPHETMRFIAMEGELTLQSKLGNRWEHIYRVVLLPRVDASMKYVIGSPAHIRKART